MQGVNTDMYSQYWRNTGGEITRDLNEELVTRYKNSGDTKYQLKTATRGTYAGQERLISPSGVGPKVGPSLIELIKHN